MVAGYLSPLLMDWTQAVTELNRTIAHTLLEKEPELLWTPIPHALDDTDHLLNELVQLTKLGSSFQPVSAIQFTLLQYRENSQDSIQLERFKFLSYLIEQSTLHDLDTRFWGECNNSTLHLVCFLSHTKIAQLLIAKGVSITPTNGLGFIPKDVTNSELIIHSLSKLQKKDSLLRSKSTVVRPNYSTPDRFKHLRELAEESSVIGDDNKRVQTVTIERKQSEVHYFRKGRVKETQKKVLVTEDEVEKQQTSKRQLEVAQLVKKSAVKNNPLWKKMEKVTFVTSPTPSPSTSATHLPHHDSMESLKQEENNNDNIIIESKPKRNSKVISSLQKKSYVSSSIFVQADEETVDANKPIPPPVPTMLVSSPTTTITCDTKQNLDNETQTITIYSTQPNDQQKLCSNLLSSDDDDDDDDDDEEEDCYFEANTSNNQSNEILPSPISNTSSSGGSSNSSNEALNDSFSIITSNQEISTPPNQTFSFSSNSSNEDISQTKDTTTTLSISSDNNKHDIYNTSIHATSSEEYSDDDDDDENDDEYGEATPVQFATRLITPVYKSVVIMNEEKFEIPDKSDPNVLYFNNNNSSKLSDDAGVDIKTSVVGTREILVEEPQQVLIPDTPVEPVPVRPQRSDLRKASVPINEIPVNQAVPVVDSKEKKRMSGSQKAAWTMSMSSWAAILDREFNLDELDQQKKERQHSLQSEKIEEESIRHSTATTINYLSSKIQISDDDDDDDNNNQVNLMHQVPSSSLSLNTTPIRSSSMISFHDFEMPTIPSITQHQPYSSQSLPPSKPKHARSPPPPQIAELTRLAPAKSISRKPIVASISETNITKHNIAPSNTIPTKRHVVPSSRTIQVQQGRLQNGKLYLHVNGIQDILLPLPKDRAYVRCVVSDGRFEYMSRYEILSQNINFDYECVIDTHPDMIITISLHVRPDYVMKSKTPFSRLFSSKKKKESLSGYVNKEDGAIGQARFALAHMLPVCVETTYPAEFHCFNAWYSRSFKERHRQKKILIKTF
ncbi:hypothetical protein BDF21DRAFT_97584 [Thamnidium elegans]|nr:hypothetical protein BDF21DRAFT_97584 [Thamnidium elegans]